MKVMLIHPPQWIPLNPHFSMASLAAQLRKYNHDVVIRDLNIEFYNEILTKEYVNKSITQAFMLHDQLFNELKSEYSDDKNENDYSALFKEKLLKYQKIKEFKTKRSKELMNTVDEIENAVAIMKDKERFYIPQELIKALDTIDTALELVSLPYHPALLEIHNYYNPFLRLTYESICHYVNDRSTNMFYSYYERILPSILAEKPDLIGLSINSSYQIIAGLTLAKMLKAQNGFHLNIGGNFFSRVVESLEKRSEFFTEFADSIIIEEGEKPIVELARYVQGEITVENVPNLLHLQDGKVVVNEKTFPLQLNELCVQDLTGFPIDKYFTPDIVLSIQASRGCYWKKCSFCDHDFGQRYNVKNLDRLISEIKEVQQKFGVSHFEFIDESVSSTYLKELATRVLDEGLKVNWFNNARLETDFTNDILKLASEAGLRMVLWGFESGSREVMELINKGIDIDKRLEILKNSRDAGIWNFAFIFFGFPTETWEDALQTIDVVCKNTDVICSYGKSIFTLGKHTRLRDDPEKYSITEIYHNDEEFSPSYGFITSKGMDNQAINKASELCAQECNKAYGSPLWMYLRYREVIFLYLSKFGVDEVQNCKIL